MKKETIGQLIGDVPKPDAKTVEAYNELIARAEGIPRDTYLEYDQDIQKALASEGSWRSRAVLTALEQIDSANELGLGENHLISRAEPIISIIRELKSMKRNFYGEKTDDYYILSSLSHTVIDAIRDEFPGHKLEPLNGNGSAALHLPTLYTGNGDNLRLAYVLGNLVITHATTQNFKEAVNEARKVDYEGLTARALEALNPIKPEDLVQTVLHKVEQDPRYERYLADITNEGDSLPDNLRRSFRTYIYEDVGPYPNPHWGERVALVYETTQYKNGAKAVALTMHDEDNGYDATFETETRDGINYGPVFATIERRSTRGETIELIQNFPHMISPRHNNTPRSSRDALNYAPHAFEKLVSLLEHKV